jgi:molecular chaperone IbpA
MMTNKMPYFDPFSFSTFPKQFNTTVGFDPILKRLAEMAEAMPKIPTYPPYNIRKVDDTKYVIEMAVAGFGRQDLELELKEDTLTVKGNVTAEDGEYLYKGIAERAFTRQFELADTVVVKNADLINGMLKIWLERFIPEEKKSKKINIGETEDKTEKQFLSETGSKSTQEYLNDRTEK